MKKFNLYFLSNKVDVILFLITIAFAIRMLRDGNDLTFGVLSFYALYVSGCIIRMGQCNKLLDENVSDPKLRYDLGMSSKVGSLHWRSKKTIIELVVDILFWVTLSAMLVYFAVS